MKRAILAMALGAGMLSLTSALAQDNVEGPYGTLNGDNWGRARLDATAGAYANGIEEAWALDVRAAGSDLCHTRTHPVFDAAGNAYWLTDVLTPDGYQYVASASPAGAFRWQSSQWLNGAPGQLGRGGVTVGATAVYAFGGGEAFDYDGDDTAGWAVAAFDKATGATIWLTDIDGQWPGLPSASLDVNGEYHPCLHDGRLYILFQGSMGLGVAILDAATGAVLRYDTPSSMSNTRPQAGGVVYVEDVFAGGFDGLFLNSGMWGPPHDVWGLRVTTSGIVQEWQQDGGKQSGRSHVVYSSSQQQLYAHTWWDDDWAGTGTGEGFGVYDVTDGTILGSARGGNHGFFDTASLGWDDASLVAGEFNGNVIVYRVAPDGSVAVMEKWSGTDNWREMQHFGQLLKETPNDVDGIYLSSTFNGDGEPDPYPAQIVLVDLSDATEVVEVDDAGAYIDDIEVLSGADFDNLVVEFGEDFETWSIGDATTQEPLWTDGGTAGDVKPQIVEEPGIPDLAPQGKMLFLDPMFEGDFPAISFLFPWEPLNNVVVLRWKQYRPDLLDDLWLCFGSLPCAVGHDADEYIHAIGYWDPASPRALQTAMQWDMVELRVDFVNSTYEVYVNGVKDETRPPFTLGAVPFVDSMYWDLTSTAVIVPESEPFASYDVDAGNDARGPTMGPDGKIYYFNSGDGKLVALEPAAPSLCAGDLNCDGIVDFDDIDPFVAALGCQGGDPNCWPPPSMPEIPADCPWLNGDTNGDEAVDFDDIDPFVARIGATCP